MYLCVDGGAKEATLLFEHNRGIFDHTLNKQILALLVAFEKVDHLLVNSRNYCVAFAQKNYAVSWESWDWNSLSITICLNLKISKCFHGQNLFLINAFLIPSGSSARPLKAQQGNLNPNSSSLKLWLTVHTWTTVLNSLENFFSELRRVLKCSTPFDLLENLSLMIGIA